MPTNIITSFSLERLRSDGVCSSSSRPHFRTGGTRTLRNSLFGSRSASSSARGVLPHCLRPPFLLRASTARPRRARQATRHKHGRQIRRPRAPAIIFLPCAPPLRPSPSRCLRALGANTQGGRALGLASGAWPARRRPCLTRGTCARRSRRTQLNARCSQVTSSAQLLASSASFADSKSRADRGRRPGVIPAIALPLSRRQLLA